VLAPAVPLVVAFATVEETYKTWGAPLKQLDPDTMPQLGGDSVPGFYRGPRGEVVEVTDWGTRRRTGAWWTRELRGQYLPPISLRHG